VKVYGGTKKMLSKATHWFRVEQQWRRVSAAADAAITLDMITEFSSSAVLFRLRPITLTICNKSQHYGIFHHAQSILTADFTNKCSPSKIPMTRKKTNSAKCFECINIISFYFVPRTYL
jgi:hypothetical protein